MQDLKVSLVQTNQKWEDKVGNLKNYERLLQNVNTDLVLLPEMFQTAFSMDAEALAEEWGKSESLKWLKSMAQKMDSAFYTSLIIKEGNSFYNRGVFVYPTREVIHYDKMKTFGLAGEDKVYSSGTKSQIAEYKGWKINLKICYDLRFPEISRNKLGPNQSALYDVLLYVANWPQKRKVHWDALLKARAIENQCYVVGLNRIGTDANGLDYSGDNQFVNALGETQRIESKQECVETFTLSKSKLDNIRRKLPFLQDA